MVAEYAPRVLADQVQREMERIERKLQSRSGHHRSKGKG